MRRIDPAGVAQLRRRGTLSECFPLVTVCPQVLRTLRLLRGDALDKSLTLGQYVSELTCLSLNRDFQRPSHVFSERADRNMRFFNPPLTPPFQGGEP